MYNDGDMMGGGGGIVMPEDDGGQFYNPGGPSDGGGGGGVIDEGNLNDTCEFIDGQFVCTTPGGPSPSEVDPPSQTECPQCNQIADTPPSGTRGNLFWDSQSIIKKALEPLNNKKKS